MRTYGGGLTLSAVVYLLVSAHPVPAQQIPPGYDLLTDARVSGALLVNSRPGSGGATALMRQSLSEVRPFFNGQLQLVGAFRYADDQRLELLFRATVRGSMVQGLGVATTEPGRGTVGYAFDNPQTIAQTLPALIGLAGQMASPLAGLTWRVAPYPDGSGQVELPDGWRITFAQKGTVSATGPHGSVTRGLHSRANTRAAAMQLAQSGIPPDEDVTLDPSDPATTLAGMWPRRAALARRMGSQVFIRILRIRETAPVAPPQGYAQAGYVDVEFEETGVHKRALALVFVGPPMADGTWLYYESSVDSPIGMFAQSLPVLMRIVASAQTAWHVQMGRLEDAMTKLREAGEIWRQTTQARQRSIERSHADWTEAFRGTRIIRDTHTGAQTDVDLGYARDIVRKLNEREPGRYREVPLRELLY